MAWRLAQSESVEAVFAAPGNPGIAECASCVEGADYFQIAREQGIDLTVVGPEAPLMDGVVDRFRQAGLAIFGPEKAAAQLEGSKIFSKNFFARHGIPTARYKTADSEAEARAVLDEFTAPVVLKADGLAAGKGVIIAATMDEACDAVRGFMTGELAGAAGKRLVIEEFLVGEEVSFIALSDGKTLLPLLPSQDHKAIFDGDKGPNTGGMGAYADERILTAEQTRQVMEQVMHPAVAGMRRDGHPFTGFLYGGLMMTAEGPRLLEFNVRMGDPETQPLFYRLESDLGEVLAAGAAGRLDEVKLDWNPGVSIAVVIASSGYPGKVRTGDEIFGLEEAEATGCKVFQAGTRRGERGQLEAAGGRVLAVTAGAETLPDAIAKVYEGVGRIQFDGMQFRKDIGGKGLRRW
jgi:phosphoribosylamine---glycine ligase